MRGDDERQEVVFSYVNTEQRIPTDHPLRGIRALLEDSLRELSLHFDALYAQRGRPSIAPERLLRALLLMVLYSIRSERQLMEQIDYNLLYRWFVGLNPDDPVWDDDGVHQESGTADAGRSVGDVCWDWWWNRRVGAGC
jgi:transposase